MYINREMKQNICAPGHNSTNYSCYTKKQLVQLMNQLIQHHPISQKWKHLNHMNLYNLLKEQIQSNYQITDESKWLELPFVKPILDQELNQKTFRPEMPNEWNSDIHTWLNSDDISRVMGQYQQKFPDFLFFGPVASDCPEEFHCELTDFSCKKMLLAGKQRIGIIFNLDKHNQSGSHWVALWISILEQTIEYYDSYAIRPPKLIHQFMKRIQQQANTDGIVFQIMWNKIRHQYGGSECGVFSMFFIVQRLHDKSFEDICNQKPTDELMNQLRLHFYRPPENTIQKDIDKQVLLGGS